MTSRKLLDGPALAKLLGLHPGTLRNWATSGRIQRYGRDQRGRTLYDLDEVAELVEDADDTPALDPADDAAHDRITLQRSTTSLGVGP